MEMEHETILKKLQGRVLLVGGAVRDQELGLEPKDLDYVVMGSTPKEMLELGFSQIGKDFPVFLHPTTGEEYALAREERSTGDGYNDFEVKFGPNVTIQSDTLRRDLTINSMCRIDGVLIDHHNGLEDLHNKVIRHTSEAFLEDPVRILRAARFAARLQFTIHPTTMQFMKQMVFDGMLEHVTPERIFLELKKVLQGNNPNVFFELLDDCGALEVIFPELHKLKNQTQPEKWHPEGDSFVHTMLVLMEAVNHTTDVEVRFAALVHDLGKGLTEQSKLPSHIGHEYAGVPLVKEMCNRLTIPSSWRDLGVITSRSHLKIHNFDILKASTIIKLFNNDDAFRKPERFKKMLIACICDANGRGPTMKKQSFKKVDHIMAVLENCRTVDTQSLIQKGVKGKAFGERVNQMRISAVKHFLNKKK